MELKAFEVICTTKYKTLETHIVLAANIPMVISALGDAFARPTDPLIVINSVKLLDDYPIIYKQGER